MKKRLDYIDLLKGVAITLVVIGHVIQFNTTLSQENLVSKFIYSFHMELFMFLSGYVAIKTINVHSLSDSISFLKRKFGTLVIPFLTWGILVNTILFKSEIDTDFLGSLVRLLLNPGIGLWFLWLLFLISFFFLIFSLVSQRFNKKLRLGSDILLVISIMVILILLTKRINLSYWTSIIHHSFFYFCGVIVSKYPILKKIMMNKNLAAMSLVFFVYAASMNTLIFKNSFVAYLVAMSAINSIYFVVNTLVFHPRLKEQIIYFGKNSLVIYATHLIFVKIGVNLELNQAALGVVSFLVSVPIIYLCLCIKNIVKLFPFCNALLYGSKLNIIKK